MKTIQTTVNALATQRLQIGFEGENERTQVRIDASEVFTEYPHATPSLTVKPHSGEAYPVLVNRDGTDVVWDITSSDLTERGESEIQLTFIKDSVICKSYIGKTLVLRSLTVEGEMPTPVESWVDAANAKLAEVDAQIVELEGMVDTATDAATRAEQSEDNATTAAANAATSAATASTKAAEAQASANTATAKASEAALSATQARNSAMSAAGSESGATAKAAEAAQSAQTAAQKAEQITEAAQIATGKAGEASASATAAQTSATNAASSATAAQAAQTAAQASETAASASATQAAQSAQTASTAAQTATQKAADASASATDAATSATNAATNAETASTKAGEAAQSAQAVEETAEQLAESLEQISQNTADIAEHEQYAEATYAKKTDLSNLTSDLDLVQTSGNIVETEDAFPTFAEDVTAEIVPVQDLHGYSNPWPGGGGANLLPPLASQTLNGVTLTNNNGVLTLNGTATQDTYFDVNINLSVANGQQVYFRAWNPVVGTSRLTLFLISTAGNPQINLIEVNASYDFVASADSSITRFRLRCPSGYALNNFVVKPMLQIGGTQPTQFEPYANICPISGFDSVKVNRTAFNAWDEEWEVGSIDSNGNNLVNATTIRSKNYIDVVPGATYYFNCGDVRDSTVGGRFYDVNNNFIKSASLSTGRTFNIPTNCHKMRFVMLAWYGATYKNDICINLSDPEKNGTYEPYHGIQVELPFGRTVYGGQIDLTTGKLTVDRAMVTVGQSGWLYYAPYLYRTFADKAVPTAIGSTEFPLLCSMLPYDGVKYASQFGDVCVAQATNSNIYIKDTSCTSAEQYYAKYKDASIVYWLATPVVYNLTAAQVLLLRDYNVLWANTGDIINLEYRAGSFVTKKTYDALKEATLIHSTASGSIASFSDGAEMPVDEVTVQINPVQDLHGYDHPWPGGGGENLLPSTGESETKNGITFTVNADGTVLVNGTATADVSFTVGVWIADGRTVRFNGCPTGGSTSTYRMFCTYIGSDTGNGTTFATPNVGSKCDATIRIYNGYTANNLLFKPMLSTKANAAYSPYSNICPITGWGGVKVTRTGKNLLKPSTAFEQGYTFRGVTVTLDTSTGEIVINGTCTQNFNLALDNWDTDYIALFPDSGRFVFTTSISVNHVDDEAHQFIQTGYFANGVSWQNTLYFNQSRTISINVDGKTSVRSRHYINIVNGVTYNDFRIKLQFEIGDTATEFVPYSGITIPVSWQTEAGTVYGGSLTIAEDGSGVLTVNRAMVGMGSMVWNYNTTYAFFTSNSISTRKIGVLNVWSDLFKTMAGSWSGTPVQNALWGNGSNTTLYVQIPPLDNVDDFMALVDGHQLMYELATPLTYTLTAAQITTLLGENNLWHDANGDISVGYKANTKLYVDNKITQAIAAALNS